jgi:predicted CXXCH cytochrome family protein
MKIRNIVTSGLVAAAALFVAQSALAVTIVGSKHDFSTTGWAGGQICVACHAPHNNLNTTGLLWNHAQTTQVYTLYSNPTTMNATLAQPAAGSVSKLCLSCHDGTVALDSFGGNTGTNFINAGASLGTSLANDHPIGFTYDAALVTADGGLKAITSAANIGAGGAKVGTIDSNLLVGGKVECSSCHDVHNTNTAITANLLKITNAGSALCLTCHAK